MPEVLDWSGAEIGKFYRPKKRPVTMRLDEDVVLWLKGYGRGYQTKANMLLRHAMVSMAAPESEIPLKEIRGAHSTFRSLISAHCSLIAVRFVSITDY